MINVLRNEIVQILCINGNKKLKLILKEINIQFYYKIIHQIGYISPLESEILFRIMRKSLLLVVFLMATYMCPINAQDLFEAPDSVCINQSIQLTSNVPDKESHYWGFCSGYLFNDPVGANLGAGFGFDGPTGIEVKRNDDGNYYGFVINAGTNSLIRLNYGTSLNNVPTTTDFGTMDGIFPVGCNSMHMVRDLADSNWYMFVTAGSTVAGASLSRIDFGKSLSNTPNIVNFGNLGNKLVQPYGVFVTKSKDDNKWYGFCVNRSAVPAEMVRFDMGENISLTPTVTSIPLDNNNFSLPTDIGALYENGKWYFYITNSGTPALALTRVDMGSLTNPSPSSTVISAGLPELDGASSITLIRDCGEIYAFVTNYVSHDIVRIEMPKAEGPYTGKNFSNIGETLSPTDMSTIIRDRDNLYAFVCNQSDGTLSKILFEQCTDVDIQFSTTNKPPKYEYNKPGVYNVYYAVNEGLPDMQVQCKLITALPIPAMIFLPPDTTICLGDTANLRMVSINAISYTWTPNYNISTPDKPTVKVWPEYSLKYNITMPFPLGSCVVDTYFTVNVIKVKADAGPDRTIKDGASTVLGGPKTITDKHLLRRWTPNQYIDDIYTDNPTVRPPHDFTYYLTVADTGRTYQCADIDTVTIYVTCDDVNLPNAFMPESGGSRAKFGLINRKIVNLDRFSIYDRWGKQVFTTTDPTNQWDGTIGGEKAAMGVYVWEVDGFCESGKRIQKTGNVTLIR